MYITHMTLENFRNYKTADILFSQTTNIIYGNNAQGKTNLLEAIYLSSHAKSFKNSPIRDMILSGEDHADIGLSFFARGREETLQIQLLKENKRRIVLNGVEVKKPARLLEHFKVVFFSPDDLQLVKRGPNMRRRYLDRLISQINPSYLANLMTYQKLIEQKNKLLKGIKEHKMSEDTLFVWNRKQAEYLWPIMKKREEVLKILQTKCQKLHEDICGQEFFISYQPSIKAEETLKSVEDIYEFLMQKKETEIRFGQAIYGAQRDDFLIEIEGKNARHFASQGQQRTAALCLKLAQSECIYDTFLEYPIILLDDIMSELDQNRRRFLLSKMDGKQMFLTCTDKESYLRNDCRYFYVENGAIGAEN